MDEKKNANNPQSDRNQGERGGGQQNPPPGQNRPQQGGNNPDQQRNPGQGGQQGGNKRAATGSPIARGRSISRASGPTSQRAAGDEAGRPRPLKVESADSTIDVEYLAHQVHAIASA
jgi:hypothetical protein